MADTSLFPPESVGLRLTTSEALLMPRSLSPLPPLRWGKRDESTILSAVKARALKI